MHITIREGCPEIAVILCCPQATEEIRAIEMLLRSHDKRLSGIRDGGTHLIDAREVFYIESVDKRCYIYTANDTYESPLRLYEWEDRLSDAGFFRGSKSQIVNIARIASLCPDFGGRMELTMQNGERLIISRQYAKPLKERLGLK